MNKKVIIAVAAAIFLLGVIHLATSEEKNTVKNQIATFETSMGTFEIELNNDLAPKTVENFTNLAKKGFYDGLIFHRVIDEFMIQGGCPDGTGMGGPGYTIQDEFDKKLVHGKPGVLSMANAGPNTGGSQFFITLVPCEWLDGKHAVFGHVISGMEVVESIGRVPTDSMDRPTQKVEIKKITIK